MKHARREKVEFERARGCVRKIRYDELPISNKRSYYCRFCEGYHLTSKSDGKIAKKVSLYRLSS